MKIREVKEIWGVAYWKDLRNQLRLGPSIQFIGQFRDTYKILLVEFKKFGHSPMIDK